MSRGVVLPVCGQGGVRKRHGSATLALAAGVDMKIVSEMLGHSRWSFTAEVYTSVFPEVAKEAAEAVAALVPRKAPGR